MIMTKQQSEEAEYGKAKNHLTAEPAVTIHHTVFARHRDS